MSTRSKRIRRTRDVAEAEILDAASSLLAECEFRDLTVSAVMERTGMKRAAFYNYFGDRNDLIVGLLGRIEHEMMAASSLWLEDWGGGPGRLREALADAIDVFARHGHVLRAAHSAWYHDETVERYYRQGFVQDFIDAVAKRIRAEKRAGRAAVPNPDAVAEALVLMNSTVLSERFGRPDKGRSNKLVSDTVVLIWERAIYGTPDPA